MSDPLDPLTSLHASKRRRMVTVPFWEWYSEWERKLEERLARERREFLDQLRERQAMEEADKEAAELRDMSRPTWWR